MRCTTIWVLSHLRWYGMTSIRYEHGDVCGYGIDRLLLPAHIMVVLVIYGMDNWLSVSLLFKWILLAVHIDVNTALCARCVGMASSRYGQGRADVCFYNDAWIGFLVNCDVMGFLRYGQRDTSLYNVGVNTIFCTHCDDIVYRQWDVCFYEIDMNEYCFRYTLCSYGLSRVWTEPCISVSIMLTWRLFQVHVVWPWLLCGMENISLYIMLSWIVLPVHTVALWAYLSRLPYGYFRETHWNSMGLLEITMVTLTSMRGAPGGAATARSNGPLWRTPRRQEFVTFASKVHPGGPSRTSVTARSPKLLKQTAPHTTDAEVWRSLLRKVNIWNANCARETAFIFDTSNGCSCESVNVFETKKMSWPEGDSNSQSSDSCRMLLSYQGGPFYSVTCFWILALAV